MHWEFLVHNKAAAFLTIRHKLNIFLWALFNGPLRLI